VVADDRVYFGATDNRVYAVRRRNGHRLWDTDVGGRVVRSPVIWSYAPQDGTAEPEPLPLLLVVPGDGSSLVVLEALTGRRVTRWTLPENGGGLVGKPLPLDGQRIALARQKYQEDEASLLVLRLAPSASPVSERRSAPGPR